MSTVSVRAFFKFLVGFLLVSLLLSSLSVPSQPVAAQPATPPRQSSEEPDTDPLLEYVRGQILYAEGGFAEGLTLQVWREGELVATAQTGDLGQFSLTGLATGLYDLQLFAGEQP
ncbi:MAG: hypothetical protein EOM24_23920, partial [Chloroflexia bacterium]|nr:hypothetical protein [Chloroflexia bacterium]